MAPHVRQQLNIQRMLRLRQREGYSLTQIATFLNIEKIPTLKGADTKWDHKTVKAILDRESGQKTNTTRKGKLE